MSKTTNGSSETFFEIHDTFRKFYSDIECLRRLKIKYPNILWNNTKSKNALEVHKLMSDIKKIISNKSIFDRKRKLNSLFALCARLGYPDIIKYLMSLDKNFQVDPGSNYNLPIRYACEFGHLDIVEYLMSLDKRYGVDPADYDNDAVYSACGSGHVDVVKYLMSLDKSYRIYLNPSIPCLCRDGHLSMIKYIMSLDKEADPAGNKNWGICWASQNGHLEIVKYLISLDSSYGIDPAAHNNYAVQSAIKGGYSDIVEYLMSLDAHYGIKIDRKMK